MVLILARNDIEDLVSMKEVIDTVERAFLEFYTHTAVCPDRIIYNVNKYKGTEFIFSSYLGKMDALAVKIATVYEENSQRYNLPTTLASIVFQDPRNGQILSLMEGTYITAIRTGAASGVATRYLARKDSQVVGVIGTGGQARTQIWAVCEVLGNVEKVKAYDMSLGSAEKFSKEMAERLKLDIEITKTSRECVENSDVIVIATTSRVPVLDGDWIKRGSHINSIGWMGTDTRELDDKTIKRAKIVVDTKELLALSGDLIIPIKTGVISEDHIYAELGEIVAKEKPGRISNDEITLWKSGGLAIEDAATAKLIYDRAMKEGVGTEVEL